MASLESLERTLNRFQREPLHVLVEHKPRSEKVSPVDLVRKDELGRNVVVCPAGQVPHSALILTAGERAALVDPPPPKPQGYMNPGHAGFTPEGVVVGGYVVEE